MKRTVTALLAVILLAAAAVFAAPRAHAAGYQDGTYSVPFSMSGLGRHNVAWDTCTVTVDGGDLFVTFTLERMEPRDHAPRYDWLSTDCGTFYPVVDEEALTCTFENVQVPNLGSVPVNVQTSAMSEPHVIEYTLVIDDSDIPAAGAEGEAPQDAAEEPAPDPVWKAISGAVGIALAAFGAVLLAVRYRKP